MLPRLRAEEVLEMATAVALGSGTIRKGDAARVHQQLERQARGSDWRPKPMGPDQLAALGIEYEIVRS